MDSARLMSDMLASPSEAQEAVKALLALTVTPSPTRNTRLNEYWDPNTITVREENFYFPKI